MEGSLWRVNLKRQQREERRGTVATRRLRKTKAKFDLRQNAIHSREASSFGQGGQPTFGSVGSPNPKMSENTGVGYVVRKRTPKQRAVGGK